jgi:hypothetical protein
MQRGLLCVKDPASPVLGALIKPLKKDAQRLF